MRKKALVVWGGWDGHDPERVAELLAADLRAHGFETEIAASLDAFRAEDLNAVSLVVPCWTMGSPTPEQLNPLLEAVRNGTGIGGVHGGMCDAFRSDTEYQFMTGGQFVAHPGNDGTRYGVTIRDRGHWITRGLEDFEVESEQYYMHVDPAVHVLATTRFPVADGPHAANGPVDMPVAWTKFYGKGRVFYCSVGHNSAVVALPPVRRLCVRGLLWAAGCEVG